MPDSESAGVRNPAHCRNGDGEQSLMTRFRFLFLGALFAAVCHGVAQNPSGNPLEVLIQSLGKIENPAAQASILKGLNASVKGKRELNAPAGWDELYLKLQSSPSDEVRQQAQALAAAFGGGAALDQMRSVLADAGAAPAARKSALDSLVAARDAAALPLLLDLAQKSGPMQGAAIRGLAAYDDPRITTQLLSSYATLAAGERQEALQTSRRASSVRACAAGRSRG
jgi:hypothetical protein